MREGSEEEEVASGKKRSERGTVERTCRCVRCSYCFSDVQANRGKRRPEMKVPCQSST